MDPILIALVVGILGLVFVGYTAQQVLKRDQGTAEMIKIGTAIQEGATAFLYAEYRILVVFVAAVAVVMAVFLSWQSAVSFIVGAFLSGLAGNIGMNIAVRANLRTAAAAEESLNDGLRVAFGSGTVMGMSVVSLSLVGMSILFLLFGGLGDPNAIQYVTGFGFGASSIALFARVGGGIYTKAADVGADLVGKVEKGIPEDDPRNPAVIADNVGDNVGDVAGMGADLFESYSGSIIAAATLAFSTIADPNISNAAAGLPFLVASVGIIASLIGTFLVRTEEGATQEDLLHTLRRAIYGASAIAALGVAGVILMDANLSFSLLGIVITGLVAGNLIGYFTEYYTSYTEKPTQGIAKSAETGAATLIIEG